MNIISRTGDELVDKTLAKANSRDTLSAEDTLWDHWITTAHEVVEDESGLVLQLSTCEQVFHNDCIDLRAPVRGIVSVYTYDDDGTATESTDYKVTKTSAFGLRVTLTTKPCNYAVIRYIAGFGEYTPSGSETAINSGTIAAHKTAIQAILLLTNHYYENRSIVSDFSKMTLPHGFDRLISRIEKHT